MNNKGKKIVEAYTARKNVRSSFDTRYKDITFYILPEYENQNSDTRNDSNVPDRPVSDTATQLAMILGSNIYSYTYQPGEQNFSLRALDDNDEDEVKQWLSHASEKSQKAIQNSNFIDVYKTLCTLYGTYGTGVNSLDFDTNREELVFSNHSINGNIYLAEDKRGRVCGVSRLLRYEASQAVEEFDIVPRQITEALNDPDKVAEKFEFIHEIVKNPDYNESRKDSMSMRYRSTYVFRDTEEIVHEEGHQTFPFFCPRLHKQTNFPYGYGCGHRGLNTTRQLNRAEADYLGAVEMESHPPVWFSDEVAANEAKIEPGFVGYFDPSRGAPFQLKVGSNAVALLEYVRLLEYRLSEIFYLNSFLSVTNRSGVETAREVSELSEEKLSVIGPIISPLQSEYFSPMIERVVDLLITNGVIEKPPEKIAGEGFRVVYTSRIDSKMASSEVNKTIQAFSEAQALFNMEQETPLLSHVGEITQAAKQVLEKRAIDADLIVPNSKRKKMEKQLNETLQKKEQAENMQNMIKPVDLQKKSDSDSPLAQIEDNV